MEDKLRSHLKQRILSLLEREKPVENPNEIIDELFNDIEEYARVRSRLKYYHLESERIDSIEDKLDKVLESSSRAGCRFLEDDGESAFSFLTKVGLDERNKAIKHLSGKIKGTSHLTICDPYFLKGTKESAIEFIKILPKSLKNLELYVKPRIRDKKFADCFNAEIQKKKIKLLLYKTEEIHDRVWIKDFNDAFVVGTSFNGLGNKCAFILDLPKEDQIQFMSSLKEVSKKNSGKSKSA